MRFNHVILGEVKVKHSKEISIEYARADGYYFIYMDKKGSTVARWMSADRCGAANALSSFAEKYLETYDWWEICYCHGYDVCGMLQWSDFYCGNSVLSILESWEQ